MKYGPTRRRLPVSKLSAPNMLCVESAPSNSAAAKGRRRFTCDTASEGERRSTSYTHAYVGSPVGCTRGLDCSCSKQARRPALSRIALFRGWFGTRTGSDFDFPPLLDFPRPLDLPFPLAPYDERRGHLASGGSAGGRLAWPG